MKVLEAKNIRKVFPGVVALDGVDIAIESGEIHCIIGENGAGKSTLIKCLTGVYKPEEGEIYIDGKDALASPELFGKVAYVPQEIDLFGEMTVAENLFMPFEKTGIRGRIRERDLEARAIPLLQRFRVGVEPWKRVRDIPISAQQLVQIVRATVCRDYEVLMLDEPTTSLTTDDTKTLFDIIRGIRAEGKAVVFISHKLDEIFELGDVITVFRNGMKVAHSKLSDVDIPQVITYMIGHSIDQDQTYHSEKVSDEVLLEVKDLTGERFRGVSFALRKGEILGFSGLVGAGRSELMQAILGSLPVYSGSVTMEGKPWKLGDPNYSVSHGYIYMPEERKQQGILPLLSVRENISISALSRLMIGPGISRAREKSLVDEVVSEYGIKTPDSEREIRFLSGGNQQKVIIGRSMKCSPKVLVFDEPTKGIDVGTKAEIYRLMKQLAETMQIGIILISSEMDEIMKCSNRIVALHEGRKSGEFAAGESKQTLMASIIGVAS